MSSGTGDGDTAAAAAAAGETDPQVDSTTAEMMRGLRDIKGQIVDHQHCITGLRALEGDLTRSLTRRIQVAIGPRSTEEE